jgi:competence protein ComEA
MTRHQKIATCFALALLAATALPLGAASGKVNINSAGVEELALLPRVGATVAQRIVDFRDDNGRFAQLDSLMLVEGIGERTFELIEPWIVLEGETTLTEKVRVARPKADAAGE